MAKTFKHLYSQICEFDNIHRAYLKARRGKRYKRDILRFSARLEESLIDVHNDLSWKSYTPGPYKLFTIHEPKERVIAALPFRDRVVHHALCNIIEPIFERSMIYDSHACRRGMGVLTGVLRTTKFLRAARRRWGRVYCLKMDVEKFFHSIDHDVLKRIIRRLRVRYYIRYMDDMVVFDGDKARLHAVLAEVRGFMAHVLRLRLNGKTQIFPVDQRCVDFLGYRIWPDYRLPRKANIRRNKRKFRKQCRQYLDGSAPLGVILCSIASWIGHCKHADTWRLRRRVLSGIGDVVRRDDNRHFAGAAGHGRR